MERFYFAVLECSIKISRAPAGPLYIFHNGPRNLHRCAGDTTQEATHASAPFSRSSASTLRTSGSAAPNTAALRSRSDAALCSRADIELRFRSSRSAVINRLGRLYGFLLYYRQPGREELFRRIYGGVQQRAPLNIIIPPAAATLLLFF
jgi:hypothetical protein